MLIAALNVEIFARVLERCGVRCEVLGFTTREWDGGEPAREMGRQRLSRRSWQAQLAPAHHHQERRHLKSWQKRSV
jgi:cobalamin biosynthesis protein CobT